MYVLLWTTRVYSEQSIFIFKTNIYTVITHVNDNSKQKNARPKRSKSIEPQSTNDLSYTFPNDNNIMLQYMRYIFMLADLKINKVQLSVNRCIIIEKRITVHYNITVVQSVYTRVIVCVMTVAESTGSQSGQYSTPPPRRPRGFLNYCQRVRGGDDRISVSYTTLVSFS